MRVRREPGAQGVSLYKIAGCCTRCDQHCFNVLAVWGPDEMLPGEPKRLGGSLEGATRITFRLLDGTHTDLTFCESCAAELSSADYVELWQKNLRSWKRQLDRKPADAPARERRPEWFGQQFTNGLLCEIGRQLWMELENDRLR